MPQRQAQIFSAEVPDPVKLIMGAPAECFVGIDPLALMLEAAKVSPTSAFNPWAGVNTDDYLSGPDGKGAAATRRWLLSHHLNITDPALILIGEAPGYRGCRVSGVPFTSERLIRAGQVPRVSEAYKATFGHFPMSFRTGGWAEPSASIVWPMLRQLEVAERTIIWNAYPFHPHVEGQRLTNRAPTTAELDEGLPFLKVLLERHPWARVVSVGNLAMRQAEQCGRRAARVRHPAHGGATEFREQLRAALRA